MLGLYGAYSLIQALGRTPLGFWTSVVLAALAVGLVGVLIEVLVLRRIYRAPELFQLLATFAVVLVIKDIALFTWGAEDLVGPRAPGLSMAVEILGRRIPAYDLLLIAIGPSCCSHVVLRDAHALGRVGAPHAGPARCGRARVSRPSSSRPCSSLLGAGRLVGALLPREPANLELDLPSRRRLRRHRGRVRAASVSPASRHPYRRRQILLIASATVHWFVPPITSPSAPWCRIPDHAISWVPLRPFGQAAASTPRRRSPRRSPCRLDFCPVGRRCARRPIAAAATSPSCCRHLCFALSPSACLHMPGRHGVVRPRRLFRPGRLCRRLLLPRGACR